MGKRGTGIRYLISGGLFAIGWAYDYCTLGRPNRRNQSEEV